MCILYTISVCDTQNAIKLSEQTVKTESPAHYDVPMAAARRKAQPRATAPRRPRLSQEEAKERLVTATIDLLLTESPNDVTVQKISKKAGVHHDYVARYFGSREELLVQAADRFLRDMVARLRGTTAAEITSQVAKQQDLVALGGRRYRLIAYLLSTGVEPARFHDGQRLIMEALVRSATGGMSERTKRNLALMTMLLVQSLQMNAELNEMTNQQFSDMFGVIGAVTEFGPDLARRLGWEKTAPKKKPPRKRGGPR